MSDSEGFDAIEVSKEEQGISFMVLFRANYFFM